MQPTAQAVGKIKKDEPAPKGRKKTIFHTHPCDIQPVGSKLKSPVFVASEMSGFKVVPSPIGLG